MTARLLRWFLIAAASGALAGLSACGDGDAATVQPGTAPTGADALPALRRDANELLGGGVAAFRARLAGLRGHPVVVNQWASWCGPCRYEFPFFATLARRYEGRVGFLGVNSNDNDDDARAFLERYPVPFPHFTDPDGEIARVFRGGRAFPTTAYYGADGELVFTHAGSYATVDKLDEDIRRYLLRG